MTPESRAHVGKLKMQPMRWEPDSDGFQRGSALIDTNKSMKK